MRACVFIDRCCKLALNIIQYAVQYLCSFAKKLLQMPEILRKTFKTFWDSHIDFKSGFPASNMGGY